MSENKRSKVKPQGTGESGPMPMSMAKKMMGQRAPGRGGPPEMMHKMMAQMSQGGENSPMEKMMGMCSEMLKAIRETNALAVHVTPELDQIFTGWLEGLEAKAGEMIAKGETDGAALASALGVTEASANYLLYRLATAGQVTLRAKART